MGFGDSYHKHPLRKVSDTPRKYSGGLATCFHCELPIMNYEPRIFHNSFSCLGCSDCDYYIHTWCQDLPIILRHRLHDQHPLTRIEPPSSSISPNLCNKCQNPCLGPFAYHCAACQLFFHLKCLFTLDHEKHHHPLFICYKTFTTSTLFNCKICGYIVWGLFFGCMYCDFYIHLGCSLIPVRLQHYHGDELTLRHNFPEECDQVVCDLCEDKRGELDRTLSYYYCKRCDYIAHVDCCITQLREESVLYESFTHEHPLAFYESFTQEHPLTRDKWNMYCNQCDYIESSSCWFPSLIKHPRHPEHTFIVVDGERDVVFNCTECQFTMEINEALDFTHPLWRYKLIFYCKSSLFRCDACGELGKGSRMGYSDKGKFDLHLECFALPGKLEHESHPHHPLYLRWLRNKSTSRYCNVCTNEMNPRLWFYFCAECDYAAHIDCVACDLISTLRSSIKNQPDFCFIIEPDKTSFDYQIADRRPSNPPKRCANTRPLLKIPDDDGEVKYDLEIEAVDDGVRCPKCNLQISTEALRSTIKDWESSHYENLCRNSLTSANGQTPSTLEPLSILDEQTIDELYCPICNVFIFPPTYSCASCQILFHKSCAELPRKIIFYETTYVLTAPPFPKGFYYCNHCDHPISSFAYYSSTGGLIFDILCASGAPLVNQIYDGHPLSFKCRNLVESECRACKNVVDHGTLMVGCKDNSNWLFKLHPECALLPPVIKHRVHHHPLELATDLAKLYDEYVCDVCEKDLNPNLWAYRCVDSCGIKATSHVTCVINSKKKCHFRYEDECQNMTEDQKLAFRQTEAGIRIYGKRTGSL